MSCYDAPDGKKNGLEGAVEGQATQNYKLCLAGVFWGSSSSPLSSLLSSSWPKTANCWGDKGSLRGAFLGGYSGGKSVQNRRGKTLFFECFYWKNLKMTGGKKIPKPEGKTSKNRRGKKQQTQQMWTLACQRNPQLDSSWDNYLADGS